MQETRNKRRAIILVLLLGATTFVYWFGKSESGYDVDPALFRQFDLSTIDQVVLESPSGKTTLKYEGSRWRVNGKFNAAPRTIQVLFATLQQTEAKRPVALSLQDSLADVIRKTGVKVSLYDKGEMREVFFAGGNVAKNQSYFLKENSNVPYVVTIPGYRVYVPGIFELAEIEWRDKIVFNFNWRNFQRLEAKFAKGGNNNFVVEMDDGLPLIREVPDADTTKLNDFLDDISLLTVDEFAPARRSLDSLLQTPPLASFAVSDVGGREYFLRLYETGRGNQYFGNIDSTAWGLFNKNKITGILRGRDFFQKPR